MSGLSQHFGRGIRTSLTLAGLMAAASVAAQTATTAAWGSYLKPFSAQSPWNSRPVNPTFSTFQIPTSTYYPVVGEGAWSTGVFEAKATDLPVTVYGPVGQPGVWDPDAEAYKASIRLPRWPGSVIPASAADGHADIVDAQAGVVHSLWQLKNVGGTWRATQYAWSPLKGSGWGDPAHYFQGARATAVPAGAGLIRKHEVNNGDVMYRHALAMSLTFNGLSANPNYVYPATSADGNAATTNTGQVPEGALLMLPPGFNTQLITSPALRKVAETLKTYGAYVVDRNTGTPFVIYVENGSGYSLHGATWNNTVAAELQLLRSQLRQVTGAAAWIDGNGATYARKTQNGNLLSMRGLWQPLSGIRTASFDSASQSVSIAAGTGSGVLANFNNRAITRLNWSKPVVGTAYTFRAFTTGGATMKLDIVDTVLKRVVYSTGNVANGGSVSFAWPSASYSTALYVTPVSPTAHSATATLSLTVPQ